MGQWTSSKMNLLLLTLLTSNLLLSGLAGLCRCSCLCVKLQHLESAAGQHSIYRLLYDKAACSVLFKPYDVMTRIDDANHPYDP